MVKCIDKHYHPPSGKAKKKIIKRIIARDTKTDDEYIYPILDWKFRKA